MKTGVLVKNMRMPDGCPFCPMSHWNCLHEFTGCEVVQGKRYAMGTDPEYAHSSAIGRPDWCPLVDMTVKSPKVASIRTPEDRRQPMETRDA